jgi:hypothetical protein
MLRTRKDGPRIRQEDLAGGREDDSARLANQQWDTHLFLELPNLGGQGRLRDEQLLRSATDAARFGNGKEIAQESEFHPCKHTLCVWQPNINSI